jgi:dihydrofolate reductase
MHKFNKNVMRKLIYSINLTIDGCCDHTKGLIPDEEMFEYYVRLVQNCDAFIYGRKTYQLMVPYWPDVAKDEPEDKFAQAFVAVKKIVVFSRTLDKGEGKNTEIFHGNLKDEILKLKQQPGKSLLTGGVDLPTQLIQLGLVDEYLILVQPLFAGEGRRLMENIPLQEKLRLNLLETPVFKSGSVALRYSKQ